jgi:hypothetical protein
MLCQRLFVACLLLLTAIDLGAQSASADSTNRRWGTWAATNSAGRTFVGTWTALPDSTGKSVTGTWTLGDGQGKTVASGAWSAAKAAMQWNGAWRALVYASKQESTGTWSSPIDLAGTATFADLFEKAAQNAINGDWRGGPNSGAWSIRAAKRSSFDFFDS